MLAITLPDNSQKLFEKPISIAQVDQSIGSGLAKAALAGRVNGELLDLCMMIEHDAEFSIITAKDPEGLEIIRHSCAHIIGHAVKQLLPNANMAIDPVIQDGLYYDISCDHSFTTEDVTAIEQRLQHLIDKEYDVIVEVASKAKAIEVSQARGETYKLRLLEGIGESESEIIKLYHHQEYIDTLHGLMRVRNFTQDDAHIFCTEAQIQDEVSQFIDLVFKVYQDFGFETILIKLSTRPEQRVGSDAIWDKYEHALEQALNDKNLKWELLPGEGAFYGPKIEFSLKDCLNRIWQCGTIQFDISMPEQLDAQYVTENNERHTPVMLH